MKWILVPVILVIGFLTFTMMQNKKTSKGSSPSSNVVTVEPSLEVTKKAAQNDFSDWTVFRNGYGIKIPPNWWNSSDTGGTAVLEPRKGITSKNIGSINKISITVLSDAKATGEQFTSQREFDEWSAIKGEVQGPIQKINTVTVDKEPGVMLLDLRGGEDDWNLITWVRKDNINIYINTKGNKKYDKNDTAAINYLISTFTFTAPTPSEKE